MKRLFLVLLIFLLVGATACDAIDTNVLPYADDTYDMGSLTYQWQNGYFSDGLFINGVPVGTGSGDVVGPAGAIGNNIVTFDGVTGKLIKDSGSSIATLGPLWTVDANGIHYSLGSVGFHTNSSATELVSMYSSDGISNSPVLWVGDNSASIDSQGIRVNMTGAKTDYTDGIYVTNQCTTAAAGSEKFGVRIQNTGNWLGVGSVNYGLYIEEPTGGTTNIGIWNDGTTIFNDTTTLNEQLVLASDGLVWLEFRPDLDPTKLAKNAKPTAVERGIVTGYSLPIGGVDEELFYDMCVPNGWDGESNIYLHIHAWLDTAQDNANDAVELTLEWQQVTTNGGVVSAGSTPVVVEVVTGVVAQFTTIEFAFLLDYDVVPADPILANDTIFFHLVRTASSQEIDGEPAIYHAGVIFRCNRLGNPVP